MDAQSLIAAAVATGTQGAVEVNQRDLIDKMLARYSSDHVVLRELLQNADDARATDVEFRFSSSVAAASAGKTSLKPTVAGAVCELREFNNGAVFSDQDWVRVARIAEGNPSEDSVGMFGVGFYSVFSLTESPLIASGSSCLAFQWAGSRLTTFRCPLPAGEALAFTPLPGPAAGARALPSATTAVMLPMREPRAWKWGELRTFFARALAFISNVRRVCVTLDGSLLFVVEREGHPAAGAGKGSAPPKVELKSSSGLFRSSSLETSTRRIRLWAPDGEVIIPLMHLRAELEVHADEEFRGKCLRILKKQLPARTVAQLLYSATADAVSGSDEVSVALRPLHPTGKPAGRVFIGLSTHQSTGTGFHCHAQLIPTVERENVDFQDSYLGRWNSELLDVIGQVGRVVYDDALTAWAAHTPDLAGLFSPKPSWSSLSHPHTRALLSACMMEGSHPAPRVGELIRAGFSRSRKQGKRDVALSVMTNSGSCPCASAYLCGDGMEAFLWQTPSPAAQIVPPGVTKLCPGFGGLLADVCGARVLAGSALRAWVADVTMSGDQLAAMLRWALGPGKAALECSPKELLESVTFATPDGSVCSWRALKHFSVGMSPRLPVPTSTLPPSITSCLPSSAWNKLGLKPAPVKAWVLYLGSSHPDLLVSPGLAPLVLSFLSTQLGTLTAADWQAVCGVLEGVTCIPVRTAGSKVVKMVKPCEAFYVPPTAGVIAAEGSHPMVSLTVIDNEALVDPEPIPDVLEVDSDGDVELAISAPASSKSTDPVSFDLLKRLGVRRLSPIAPMIQQLRECDSAFQRLCLLRSLAAQWPDLSDTDRADIRTSPILPVRLDNTSGGSSTTLCAPSRIILPSTLVELGCPVGSTGLPVLYMPELHLARGSQHSAMLVKLGVPSVPPLATLLSLCANPEPSIRGPSFAYFATHLRSHYSSSDNGDGERFVAAKVTTPFLPCVAPLGAAAAVEALVGYERPAKGRKPASSAVGKKGNAKKRSAIVIDSSDDEVPVAKRATVTDSVGPSDVIMCAPRDAFAETNPFFPSLLPSVCALLDSLGLSPTDLGVKAFPTMDSVMARLRTHPPATTTDAAAMLTCLQVQGSGLTAAVYAKFASIPFVPLPTGGHACPTDVFVREEGAVPALPPTQPAAPAKKAKKTRAAAAAEVVEAVDDVFTGEATPYEPEALIGLVQFVDLGPDGNSFLRSCGAKGWPTPAQLAEALVIDFESYQAAQPPEHFLSRHRSLLVHIGLHFSSLPAMLRKRLSSSLLLPTTTAGDSSAPAPVSFLPPPAVFLSDDPALEAALRPPVPEHPSLYKLCASLGCAWLLSALSRQPVVTGALSVTPLARALQARLLSRCELLVRGHRGDELTGLQPNGLSWLRSLVIAEAPSVGVAIEFNGKRLLLGGAEAISTCVTLPPGDKAARGIAGKGAPVLAFVRDTSVPPAHSDDPSSTGLSGITMIDVSSEIARGLFTDSEYQSRLTSIDFVLMNPLSLLRRRGMPVDRFIRDDTVVRTILPGAPVRAPPSFGGDVAVVDLADEDDDVVEVVAAPTRKPAPMSRVPVFSPTLETPASLTALIACTAPKRGGAITTLPAKFNEGPEDDDGSSCMCDVDMQRFPCSLPNGIQLFVDPAAAVFITKPVQKVAACFARLLSVLAKDVFGMGTLTGVNMYADVDRATIAFNKGGALYFNLRCFVQSHTRVPYGSARSARKVSASPQDIAWYWFVVFAHELAHNGATGHNKRFNSLHEGLLARTGPAFQAIMTAGENKLAETLAAQLREAEGITDASLSEPTESAGPSSTSSGCSFQ